MLCDRNSWEEDRNSQMTCLTCLSYLFFTDFSYLTIFIIFYNLFFYSGFYISSFRIWDDFLPFHLLGFRVIFRHSVFQNLGRFSAIPSFRIWGYFPPFCHSVISSFHHSMFQGRPQQQFTQFRSRDDSFGRLQLFNLPRATDCMGICTKRTIVTSQMNHHVI